jgi:hypothetical protein
MPKVGKKPSDKVECLNPNTGAKLNIDTEIYKLFTTAIKQTLKGKKAITYTDMVAGIKKYIKSKKIIFKNSVLWYAVTVKNDMEVRKMIETYFEKGRKLHRWKD